MAMAKLSCMFLMVIVAMTKVAISNRLSGDTFTMCSEINGICLIKMCAYQIIYFQHHHELHIIWMEGFYL